MTNKYQNPLPFRCEKCGHTFGNWWQDREIPESSKITYEDETCPACGSDDICGNNEDTDENQDATYVCIWGAGFPSTYSDMLQIEIPSFFSTNLGYDVEDIQIIMNLAEGDSFYHPHGGHIILRVQDGFKPKGF